MLVTTKEILDIAKKEQYAIGAFNATTLATIRAIIQAAEELNSPVILQHAESHDAVTPLDEIGPIMLRYADKAKVPVAVHLDHGTSLETCVRAMKLGFTSVMYDASSKDYETNVKETAEIVKIAHALNVSVEAELGHVFTSSIGGEGGQVADDFANIEDTYTDPDTAKDFVEKTGVDCLAIAFGTVHGIYVKEPKLDLPRIKSIKEKTNIPLVMHGGSGVSDEDYQIAIKNGICKVNYYTYMNMNGGRYFNEFIQNLEKDAPLFADDAYLAALAGMKEKVKEAITTFGSSRA